MLADDTFVFPRISYLVWTQWKHLALTGLPPDTILNIRKMFKKNYFEIPVYYST